MSIFTEYYLARKRKERQNRKTFAALITTPAIGSFTMPGNARLLLRSIAGSVEGANALSITGPSAISIKSKNLAAGDLMFVGYVSRASVVVPEVGFEVLLDYGLGIYIKIAEGV